MFLTVASSVTSHPLHISHPSHTHQRWVGGDWCYVSSSTVSSLATISSIVVSLLSIVSTSSSSSSPLSKHLVQVSTPLFCSQFEWIKQIKNLPRHTVRASLQTWFIYRNNKLLKYFTVLSVTVTRQNNSDLIVLIWHGFCWLSQLRNFAFLGIWLWAQTEYSRTSACKAWNHFQLKILNCNMFHLEYIHCDKHSGSSAHNFNQFYMSLSAKRQDEANLNFTSRYSTQESRI